MALTLGPPPFFSPPPDVGPGLPLTGLQPEGQAKARGQRQLAAQAVVDDSQHEGVGLGVFIVQVVHVVAAAGAAGGATPPPRRRRCTGRRRARSRAGDGREPWSRSEASLQGSRCQEAQAASRIPIPARGSLGHRCPLPERDTDSPRPRNVVQSAACGGGIGV